MNMKKLLFLTLLVAGWVFAQPRTEMVAMRDGVRLATDIYLPSGKGPWPVVLVRTPYNKTKKTEPQCWPEAWLPNGYAYVEQDWRGRYASEGKFTPTVMVGKVNALDSYDTVEWVAKQPWCNGKVGMTGGSATGNAAKSAILVNPPHLVAAFTNFSGMYLADYEYYHGGVPWGQADSWFKGEHVEVPQWPKPRCYTLLFGFEHYGWPPDHQDAVVGNRIPLIDNGGWYDVFDPSGPDDFMARHSAASRLVMGARGHSGMTGSLTYPSQKLGDDTPQAWLDHWLKGVDNGVTKTPPIRYFLMGDTLRPGAPGNVWKQADRWPIPNTPTSFYLTANGSLATAPPAAKGASISYAYDPKDPVPTVGGNNMGDNKGPMDQRKLEGRKDILRFQTQPLSQPLEVTGKVMVEVYVSGDVPDTNVMAKLIDIYPNGYQAIVLDNAMMTRYRNGFDKPAPLEKGQVAKLSIDLWNTALLFDKGHRIAVHITGSNAPRYEIHPNSYKPVASYDGAPIAHVAVQTSAQYPSRLILPVIAPGVSKDYGNRAATARVQ